MSMPAVVLTRLLITGVAAHMLICARLEKRGTTNRK